MGQTLTHGVYLPDEGERNCYNGLAANWSILDGAVGTIAEHTSALAGKANAVHTHTKADITDFPAYGNAAGTICEGNDSRLSDARTPVAHTHTKSDVIDLFNSANTWTGDNTFSNTLNVQTGYTLGTLPQAESAVTLFTGRTTDNNFVTSINFYQNPIKGTGLRFTIRNKWDNNGYSTTGTTRNAHFELLQSINKIAYMQWEGYVNNGLYPLANNTYDLGSASYQWNNLYAKNYYYNGVAWGLDKANVWTQNQVIASSNDKCYFVKDTIYELGQDYPNGEHLGGLTLHDKNGATVGLLDIVDRSYGNMEMRIRVQQKFDPNSNNRSTSGNILFNELILGITPTKTNYIGFNADLWGANTYNLGTSTNKWKTLNGINPGALSLPNVNAVTGSSNTQLQDISGDLVQDQYFNCYFTPRMDGWAYIALDCSNATIRSGHSSYTVLVKTARVFANAIYAQSFTKNENAFSKVQIFIPVTANKEITLECTFTGFSVTKGYVIPCLGNV